LIKVQAVDTSFHIATMEGGKSKPSTEKPQDVGNSGVGVASTSTTHDSDVGQG
jgi:hypothetical protein